IGSMARARCATKTASSRRSISPPKAGSARKRDQKPDARSRKAMVDRSGFWLLSLRLLELRAEFAGLGEALWRQTAGLGAHAPPIAQIREREAPAGRGDIGQAVFLREGLRVGPPAILVALQAHALAARHLRQLLQRKEQKLAVV